MTSGLVVMLLGSAAGLSWLLTGRVMTYGRQRLMDLPNDRSSHEQPTPRGGGLAIVIAFSLSLVILFAVGLLPWPLLMALSALLPLAVVGFIDDHGHVSARWRFLLQAMSAGWALYWLGGIETLRVNDVSLALGPVAGVLAGLFMVWMLNLFNFMDGIDGFAGIEGASVFLLGGAAFLLRGPVPLGFLCLGLTGALGGFLLWNWPPAQIFMGDVGSGFLGFLFAAVALAGQLGGIPIPFWMVLGTGFFVDATATLLLRVGTGNSPVQPHREHAYQRLARHGLSHRTLSLALGSFNALWGLAALVALVLAPQALMPLWGASWSAALAVWVLARCLPPTTDGTRRV